MVSTRCRRAVYLRPVSKSARAGVVAAAVAELAASAMWLRGCVLSIAISLGALIILAAVLWPGLRRPAAEYVELRRLRTDVNTFLRRIRGNRPRGGPPPANADEIAVAKWRSDTQEALAAYDASTRASFQDRFWPRLQLTARELPRIQIDASGLEAAMAFFTSQGAHAIPMILAALDDISELFL